MAAGLSWRTGLARVVGRPSRPLLIATTATLLSGALCLGLITAIRWQGQAAVQGDTRAHLTQVSRQLVRTLQSRRGTLTLLRDTLRRRSDLSPPQLQALGASAVAHTRDLLGIGRLQQGQSPRWWVTPRSLSPADVKTLQRALIQRSRLRGTWQAPSTFLAPASRERQVLIMLEPVQGVSRTPQALIGVVDFTALLDDFFATTLTPAHPLQLTDGAALIYQSPSWRPLKAAHPLPMAEQAVAVDAARWTLRMAPARTGVVQALSWFRVLLIALSLLVGLGVTFVAWLLVTRAWLLQRVVARRTAALRRSSERLRQLAVTDELTGLHNRRFFLERWRCECRRAKRYHRPLACLMVDVNGFKAVNDRLGHATGDAVLRRVAHALQSALRQSDTLARYGGDEFVAALPETTVEQSTLVAEKLQRLTIPVPNGESHGVPSVDLSVGIGRLERRDESPQAVLEAADASLYRCKQRRAIVMESRPQPAAFPAR